MEYLDTYKNDLSYEAALEDDSFCKNDGWWAAFLVFAIIFGPQTKTFAILPPIRFDDFVIVFLLAARWLKALRLYGGFLFSPRIRPYSVSMLALIFIMCF